MDILVQRKTLTNKTTIGNLLIDGQHFCYTLEDVVREVEGEPPVRWKINGETAIPRGKYKVKVSYSPHFEKYLPEILDVPGWTNVRFHGGNGPEDSEGCLLVGSAQALNRIWNCAKVVDSLTSKILFAIKAGETVWLTIE
jgi:hypothetical protein